MELLYDLGLWLAVAIVITGIIFIVKKIGADHKSTIKYKDIEVSTDAAGTLMLIVGLAFFSFLMHQRLNIQTSITALVTVRGKKGPQDVILKNKGSVIMQINGEPLKRDIDKNGQSYFENTRVGESAKLSIDFSEPYVALNPDSTYIIPSNGRIYMVCYLKEINHISGRIIYNDQPLSGVLVKITSLQPGVITDSNGEYRIYIPDSVQAQEYEVWFKKNGFKSFSDHFKPQTGEFLNELMEKANN